MNVMLKGNQSFHEFNELLAEKFEGLTQTLRIDAMVGVDFDEKVFADMQAIVLVHECFMKAWDEVSYSHPATVEFYPAMADMAFSLFAEELVILEEYVWGELDKGELHEVDALAFAEAINETLDELAEMGYVVFDEEDTWLVAEEFMEFISEKAKNAEEMLDHPSLTETQENHLAGQLIGLLNAEACFTLALGAVELDPSAGLVAHGVFPVFANLIHEVAVEFEKTLEDIESSEFLEASEGFFDSLNMLMNEMIDMGVIIIDS